MIPIKKEYLAGGLLLAAAGVWIPQFLAPKTEERPTDFTGPRSNDESSAGTESAEGLETVPDEVPETAPDVAPDLEQADTAGGGVETAPSPPSASRTSSTGGTDLAALLEALAEPEPQVTAPLEDWGEASEEGDDEVLRAFAADNPFQGLIRGPGEAIALLGHRPAHVGDVFENGRIELSAIEADRLRLSAGEATLEVPLPAFQARASASVDGQQASSGEDSDAADDALDGDTLDDEQAAGTGGEQ